MARLIVKSPYIKGGAGGGPGGYLKYIGTREGVELLPAGYMEYMAERPHSHGLFGDEDNVDMDAAMKELNEYPGNIWTHVISLKREDAERLGYDHAAQWRNLIRAHRNEIAAAMNIPPGNFRWYAAFHDEGDHPHIHMMAWSVKLGQAYLSKDGIRKIKSTLTNDIFKQEMLHVYEQKSESRDELVRRVREEMKTLAQEMQTSLGDHPEVESLMMTLTAQLETVKGKKKYGYLPKAVKKTVDEIVDLMEQLPVVNECYQTWWELQCQIEDFYSERERRRPPLSQQKEFRSIKNAVIQEAENIRMGKVTFEDEKMEEPTEFSDLSYDCWALWIVTQDDTAPMEDRDEAAAQLLGMAKKGNTDAQYLVGRLYRDGPVLIPDSVESQYWFDQSARQGHVPAQYALGKLYLTDDAEVHDTELGIQWLEYAAHHGSDCAAYQLGKEYLKGEIVKRDSAKAMEYLTQSAETGNQFAQYTLGKLYLDRRDEGQAYRGVELTDQSKMSLSEWLGKWLDERMVGTIRNHTLEGYRQDINNHVDPYLGQKQLSKITPSDLNDLYTFLLERGRIVKGQNCAPGLAPATVRGIHTILHHALKTATEEGLIPSNPASKVVPPKIANRSKGILNNEQLDTLMKAIAKDELWHDFFYTELTTGLRRGELCGLKWEDFDSKAGTLKICRTIRSGKGGTLEAGDTKTYAGKRTILLPHSTIQLLKKRKESALTEWIFPDLLNLEKPTHPQRAYRQLKKILVEAGLPSIRFHDLRHTFATHALAGGVDAKTLSGILGHTKASFTLDTYAHITGDMQHHAAQIVGGFIQDIL